MRNMLERVKDSLRQHKLLTPGDTVVIGVSGGADSLVLLHTLLALRDEFGLRLHVATLDHRLRGAAGAEDASFVQRTAQEWGLPVVVGRADVLALARRHRMGTEEAARQVRYAFLLKVARHLGAARIAVGHTLDDQAETVLMHLIRGSGLDGLRGMPPAMPLGVYFLPVEDTPIPCEPPLTGPPAALDLWPVLVRPLLDVPHADITAYAAAHDLHPRQDATNEDLTYFRNRLRHSVMPLLATLNPNIRATLARTADVLRADADWMAQAGAAAQDRVVHKRLPGSMILDRAAWITLELAEKRAVLRAILSELRPALRNVSYIHIAQALTVADSGSTGAAATLPGGLMLRVTYETLWIGPSSEFTHEEPTAAPNLEPGQTGPSFLPGDAVTQSYGGWTFEAGPLPPGTPLEAVHADPLVAALAVPPGVTLYLRTRQPGDRFLPHGLGGHSQKLADTLITKKVPTFWRARVPLLVAGDQIAWFVAPTPRGLVGRVAAPYAILPDSASHMSLILVRWRPA